jgi:hypothetical protein
VACPLEARIVKQAEIAVDREGLSSRRVINSRDTHAAIELLEAVFPGRAVQRLYTNIGQGEARHIKYKRLKLDGSQAYDRSSD